MFKNYTIRSSSLGRIMGGLPKPLTTAQEETYKSYKARKLGEGKPLTVKQEDTLVDLLAKKNGTPELNQTAKTYLEELVWSHLTGRRKNLTAKYLDKGIQQEEKSITLYSDVTKKLFIKNKDRLNNDILQGECDNAQGKIRDIKTSWEFATFPLRDIKIKNAIYDWQLRAYMILWDMQQAELIYCLVDTPIKLLTDELRRLDWKHDTLNNEGEATEEGKKLIIETVSNHIYTFKGLEEFCSQSSIVDIKWFEGVFKEIPEELRIKVFEIERCSKKDKQIRQMIIMARAYMNEVVEGLGESIIKLKK